MVKSFGSFNLLLQWVRRRVMRFKSPEEVLVTGGSGFIGRATVAYLQNRGHLIYAPLSTQVDLRNHFDVVGFFGERKFDHIIHLASEGVRSDAFASGLVESELAMAKNLSGLIKEGGSFIFGSSVPEYGRAGRLSETERCAPMTSYGLAKSLAGEWLLSNAGDMCARVCVARIFGAYGPFESQSRLFPTLVKGLTRGRSVSLSDGEQIRDFVHVADIASVLGRLLWVARLPSVINVGTGVGLSVRTVAEGLCGEICADPNLLRFGARPRSQHDLDYLVADVTKLRDTLGQVPEQHLRPDNYLKAIQSMDL